MSRLFFALIPDDLVRQKIAKIAAQLPAAGQKVKASNLHATLAFLGEIQPDQIAGIQEAASKIRCPAFDIHLDSREWWKSSALTCMGASAAPRQLENLIQSLNDALEPCGYQPETRPFRLHISLMRNVQKPINHLTFKQISWLVRNFSLVESIIVSGETEYRVIQTWDFVG